jgi:transposase-like protein
MRFSFMSGRAFRIATSKKLWKKEGVNVDHATLNRWVIRYSPAICSGQLKPDTLI